MGDEQKSVQKVSYKKYLGYKFYLDKGNNNFDVIKVIRVYEDNTFKVKSVDSDMTRNMGLDTLRKYTPLEPIGVITFNILLTEDNFDVMVAAYKLFDIKMGDNNPYVVCRQGVRDFFYDLCCKGDPEVENHLVGVSVSRDTCPANMNINELTACDMVVDTRMVHFYREDSLKDILECLNQGPFNKILNIDFTDHIKSDPKYQPFMLERKEKDGWCKNIKTLLEINNFMGDIDSMLQITAVDFIVKDYLISSEVGYQLNELALTFFDYVFKVNAVDTRVIKYDNSVNLADFNNSNYTLIRDKKNILYIVVYLVQGEYLESELEDRMNKLSVSDKLRLSYYDKYSKEMEKTMGKSAVKVSQNFVK